MLYSSRVSFLKQTYKLFLFCPKSELSFLIFTLVRVEKFFLPRGQPFACMPIINYNNKLASGRAELGANSCAFSQELARTKAAGHKTFSVYLLLKYENG
jgi:hypothetical protein